MKEGRTSLFVAHRLSTAAACDYIAVLEVRLGAWIPSKPLAALHATPVAGNAKRPPVLRRAGAWLRWEPMPSCLSSVGGTQTCGRSRFVPGCNACLAPQLLPESLASSSDDPSRRVSLSSSFPPPKLLFQAVSDENSADENGSDSASAVGKSDQLMNV